MKQKSIQKPYWEMTTGELSKATKEFDQEFIGESFQPMNEGQRARWERMKRKPTLSKAQTISVSIKKTLLKRSYSLAKKQGLTRDALIDRALKTVLAAAK